jgi:hypothetical protein
MDTNEWWCARWARIAQTLVMLSAGAPRRSRNISASQKKLRISRIGIYMPQTANQGGDGKATPHDRQRPPVSSPAFTLTPSKRRRPTKPGKEEMRDECREEKSLGKQGWGLLLGIPRSCTGDA